MQMYSEYHGLSSLQKENRLSLTEIKNKSEVNEKADVL